MMTKKIRTWEKMNYKRKLTSIIKRDRKSCFKYIKKMKREAKVNISGFEIETGK